MILHALNEYYDRLARDEDSKIPAFGFGQQGVHFCLTLDRQGQLVDTPMDLRTDGRALRLEVPGPVQKTSGISSNFAWDNTGYVLGADDKGKPERTAKTHAAFKKFIRRVLQGVDDVGAHALLAFLEGWNPDDAPAMEQWDTMVGQNVVFRLDGEREFLHDRPAFRKAWIQYLDTQGSEHKGMCLVTGQENVPIPATHASIKGVMGAQSSGAALVSFNFDAAGSFGKKQSFNAPVSERAAFAYTTVLNRLLAPGSDHKVQVGDTTVVFWADKPVPAVSMFGHAMGAKEAEDSDLTLRLEQYLTAVTKGVYPDELGDPDVPFYILGLAPNAARLSVRFWHVGTVGSMAANIGAHFQALRLQRSFENEPEHPRPWWLLKELAAQRDSRNISPLLGGQLLRAILLNQPYPRTLLTAALGRIRADKQVNYLRACIIKAYLVRHQQYRNKPQEIPMALDKDITNIGYRLGRLFAIVEKVQEEAVSGANCTVRDRFFSAASATPGRTFPVILRNMQHGLAKIRKSSPGRAVNMEKDIQEILGSMDASTGFPATLTLEKQGMFVLGYYQQRQNFYTSKSETTED